MSHPHANGVPSTSAVPLRRCPVTHQTTDQEDFEHDFTTPGKIGDLSCPFAIMAQNGLHTPNSQQDPIAAEFHADKASVVTPSAAPVGVCPIRFLDKHSPQEVAQYFENHKHEIPRSHEICVKRYQRNEQSIRLLDAKYGNLVNMIQGLGNKHQQYLPTDKQSSVNHAEDEGLDQGEDEGMKQWAENVSKASAVADEGETANNAAEEPTADDPNRVSHFERPLREIRVGESPSRPWGIPVPADREIPPSAKATNIGPDTPQNVQPKPTPQQNTSGKQAVPTSNTPSQPIQIIFNGPVFLGYTPEDAAIFFQHLGVNSIPNFPPPATS